MKKQSAASHAWFKRGLSSGLSVVLAMTLLGTAPAAAFASDADVQKKWTDATEQMFKGNADYPYSSYVGDEQPIELTNDNVSTFGFALKYSLYDEGLVTPVKKQNPWGACWAFGTIAAAETSILSKASEEGVDLGENFDLSEKALVNFVYSENGTPESVAGASQAGEGGSGYGGNSGFNQGGKACYGMTLFSAGIGLVPESEPTAQYRNKEGIIECSVEEDGSSDAQTLYMTQEQIDAYKEEHPTAQVTLENWAGRIPDGTSTDWSVDDLLWELNEFTLTDANVLPETRVLASDESKSKVCKFTDAQAVAALKSEIQAGHGIAIGICDDGEREEITRYFDRNTWSHYTWERKEANHRVCIVGWDDTYAASNFQNSAGKTPPGDGAWIVKQSAGAQSEGQDFQNYGEWGIENDKGEHTGYFYLSYYDQSLSNPVSYSFDLEDYGETSDIYTDQYDFMPERSTILTSSDEPTSSANIFTAQGDMTLNAVMGKTYKSDTTVTYQVYLLDDDATSPTDPDHSRLACEFEATYACGGYHRTEIEDSSKWVSMRKGQRYAVVSTQKCKGDGKWYQGVAYNWATFSGKVNAGESWTGVTEGSDISASSSQTEWTDWTKVADSVKSVVSTWQVDNASIKGISQARSWATVDELNALKQAIADAQAKLDATKVSSDGSDVEASDMWATQASCDAFRAAIAAAQATLDLAGENFETEVAYATPTSDEVSAKLASLTFDAKAGTKVAGEQAEGKAAGKTAASKANATYAATNDGSLVAAAALSCVAAIAAVAIVVSCRRRRDEE